MKTAFYIPRRSFTLQRRNKPAEMKLLIPQGSFMPGFRVRSRRFGPERPSFWQTSRMLRNSPWFFNPWNWPAEPWLDNFHEDLDFRKCLPAPTEIVRIGRCDQEKGYPTRKRRKRHTSRSVSPDSRSCPKKKSEDVKEKKQSAEVPRKSAAGLPEKSSSLDNCIEHADKSDSASAKSSPKPSCPRSEEKSPQKENRVAVMQEESEPLLWTQFVKVEGFSPENIRTMVKHEDRLVTISGREEISHSPDGDLVEYREMKQELRVPEDVDLEKVRTYFFSDGRLRLQAPRMLTSLESEATKNLGDLSLREIEADTTLQPAISPIPDTPGVKGKEGHIEKTDTHKNCMPNEAKKVEERDVEIVMETCKSEAGDENCVDSTYGSIDGMSDTQSEDEDSDTYVFLY